MMHVFSHDDPDDLNYKLDHAKRHGLYIPA